MVSLYETDFAAWSPEQASAIRDAGRPRVNAPMRALVRATLADYGETPIQLLDAIAYGEATILGDWLPDRRS